MTDERAIEILDPEHREHYESIEPVEEACRIGMNAIKRVKELEAENAELRATLSKMETVEKELRARLDKAVELPTIYEHISYPYVERMYSETIYYVIYKENGRIMTEKFGKNKSKAEARLKELQGGKR